MSRASRNWTDYDLVVYLLILALGALEFALSRRAPDYLNDTNYFELFKSVVNHTQYGFNHKPMTQLPPGLPYLLTWLSLAIGSGYTVFVRAMTVFTTLGLIASYELLRSQQDRVVAAASCLLLGSAPALFAFSTTLVFADMPYFFASVLLLYGAIRLDAATNWRLGHTLMWLLWGALLVGTVLLKSVGISLLGAFFCWMVVSYFKDPKVGTRRLRLFLPLIIVGAAAQAGWMSWAAAHQVHEWSTPGYQEHYVAQLRLKNANEPELGLATWKDIVIRPIAVADDIAAATVGLFTHKQMAPAWYSPGTLLPLILILLGLWDSFRRTGGGLLEWYFVCYELMFLFWPWDFELRFLFPVAPLAFLYAWRGGRLLWRVTLNQSRLLGTCGLALAIVGSLSSMAWGQNMSHPQLRWCLAMWLLVAAVSAGILWTGREGIQKLTLALGQQLAVGGVAVTRRQTLIGAAVACAFLVGVAFQIKLGLANLDSDLSKDEFNYPEIEAAQWIKAHSTPSAVIMARKDDMVYHYSQRRVIWFPASRDTGMLMDGIRRFHVQYVVVHSGNDTYWRPSAQQCFEQLSQAYPGAFKLAHEGPHNRVFEVSEDVFPVSLSQIGLALPDGTASRGQLSNGGWY